MKLFGRYKKKYKKAHRIRFPKLLNYLNLTRRKKCRTATYWSPMHDGDLLMNFIYYEYGIMIPCLYFAYIRPFIVGGGLFSCC